MDEKWNQAVTVLIRGGAVVYPTETFYALGCLATSTPAVERVFTLKGRAREKTLPLIVADWRMVSTYLRLQPEEYRLARLFWPGPLSLVVEVDDAVSPLARDSSGRSAVRMTPHPIAGALCRAAGAPLVSSSANKSGEPPVSAPARIDPRLRAESFFLDALPWPAGGLPSTLIKVRGTRIFVVREGALPSSLFVEQGFSVQKI